MKTEPQKDTFADELAESTTVTPASTAATVPAKKRAASWAVLRHRDFALLFSGQMISSAGTQM